MDGSPGKRFPHVRGDRKRDDHQMAAPQPPPPPPPSPLRPTPEKTGTCPSTPPLPPYPKKRTHCGIDHTCPLTYTHHTILLNKSHTHTHWPGPTPAHSYTPLHPPAPPFTPLHTNAQRTARRGTHPGPGQSPGPPRWPSGPRTGAPVPAGGACPPRCRPAGRWHSSSPFPGPSWRQGAWCGGSCRARSTQSGCRLS